MITNLKNLTIVNPNYIACIMWKDQYGRTYRYQLWYDIGETVPLGFPLYAGQIIKKNFRIEIWSINGQNITETVGSTLITSVLQGIDYRFGNDAPIGNNDGEVTNFAAIASPITNLPVDLNPYLQARWLASTVVNGQPWVSSDIHAYSLAPFGGPGLVAFNDNTIATNPVAYIEGINTVVACNITPGHIFLVVNIPAQGTSILYNFDGLVQSMETGASTPGFVTVAIEDGNSVEVPINTWVIIEAGYVAGQSFIRYFNLESRTPWTNPTLVASTTVPSNRTVLTVTNGFNNFYVADMEFYVGYLGNASQEVLTYLYNRYNYNFTLPLTFPANSSPQPNTI